MIKEEEITSQILKSFYNVYNKLGYGFLEKVYEKSMIIELVNHKITVQSQSPIDVHFENQLVGSYYADLLIEQKVIVELKAEENIHPQHQAQLLNYLKQQMSR